MQRFRAISEWLRSNFFVLPALAVVGAFFGARVAVGVDVGEWVGDATIDSARALMSTVAAATITFASIAFSVSLLIMQQGSSQFSARVIDGLTRDPFNRRVIALVAGTFTYCLVVLQRTHGAIEEGGDEIVPRFAVALGLVLGLAAVLAVVGAIHHTARMMDVSRILGAIVENTLAVEEPLRGGALEPSNDVASPAAGTPGTVVRFHDDGWIRQVDRAGLLRAVRPGAVVRLETEAGRYAIRSTALCTIWPEVAADEHDEVVEAVRDAIRLGRSRTMVEDRAFGVRQLVDIALRALSPGVNDPTTAQDAVFHLGTVLVAGLELPPPPTAYRDRDGRRLLIPHVMTDAAVAELAFTELRAAATGNATVATYLLEVIADVVDAGRAVGAGERVEPYLVQAWLLAEARHGDAAAAVTSAYADALRSLREGSPPPGRATSIGDRRVPGPWSGSSRILATIALSSDVAVIEGITAFATLVALQFVVAWRSARSARVREAVRSEPVAAGRLWPTSPTRAPEQPAHHPVRIHHRPLRLLIRSPGERAPKALPMQARCPTCEVDRPVNGACPRPRRSTRPRDGPAGPGVRAGAPVGGTARSPPARHSAGRRRRRHLAPTAAPAR